MMMRCLALASQLKPVIDPDLDVWSSIYYDIDDHPNPNGFYQSSDWDVDLPYFYDAYKGRLIKLVRASLPLLPRGRYKLIFMTRNPDEIIASMRRFTPFQSWGWAETNVYFYEQVKNATLALLRKRGDFEILEISYNDVTKRPRPEFEKIAAFGFPIEVEKAAALVDESLYRVRL